ncbi:hypothetical protein Golob_009141 [Gossypium lobatum]|uniref:Uncharacterized protein n=1 Tax=Gossypium lobatum TaxID=34289 RepID=A0A7J8MHR3_9ROSI|nr:hypothetical protein [Gossypium lobatum]
MGFQSKSSLQAENTVDDDDVMEEFNGEDSESGSESDQDSSCFTLSIGRDEAGIREVPVNGVARPKRGKNKEAKRIAKEVQAEKLKERAKQKKQEIEATVNHSRGQARKDQGCLRGIDLEVRLSKAVKRAIIRKQNREFWNSKFGFRGRIGFKKQNTAETTNDLKGFNNGSIAGNKKRKR